MYCPRLVLHLDCALNTKNHSLSRVFLRNQRSFVKRDPKEDKYYARKSPLKPRKSTDSLLIRGKTMRLTAKHIKKEVNGTNLDEKYQ